MTGETKSEIIIVAIAGAVLAVLWLRNRQAGAGTGLEALPFLSKPQQTVPGAAPSFNIPAPVPGETVAYTGNLYALPSPSQFSLDAGAPSACNCQTGSQSNATFGSSTDLSAWLSSQPGVLSSLADAVTNWT